MAPLAQTMAHQTTPKVSMLDAKQAGKNGMPLASKKQPKKASKRSYSRK
jgi:hypothetical protein